MYKNANYLLSEIDDVEEEVALPLDSAPAAAEDGPEVEGEEAEEEAEVPRKAREPHEPTDEERRRHETTRLPFQVVVPLLRAGSDGQPAA